MTRILWILQFQQGGSGYIKQTSAEYRLQIMQNYLKHPLCHYKLHWQNMLTKNNFKNHYNNSLWRVMLGGLQFHQNLLWNFCLSEMRVCCWQILWVKPRTLSRRSSGRGFCQTWQSSLLVPSPPTERAGWMWWSLCWHSWNNASTPWRCCELVDNLVGIE